jgi:hypothetical protein
VIEAIAAAEGNPGIGPGSLLKKTLRPESFCVGVDVGAPMHEVDRGHHKHPGRQPDAADLHRRFEPPIAARVGSLVCPDGLVQQRNSQIMQLVRSDLDADSGFV